MDSNIVDSNVIVPLTKREEEHQKKIEEWISKLVTENSQVHKVEELYRLTEPLKDWLKKNYDPHTKIIIDSYNATVVRDEIGVAFKED